MKTLKQRICLVVTGNTLPTFIENLQKAQQNSTFIELRIDTISGLDKHYLKTIADLTHTPAIVTCRAKAQGGHFQGSVAAQNAILQMANDLNFPYLDIDQAIIDQITLKNQRAQTILSYHNFQCTPSLEELNRIKNAMLRHTPDVMKFATTAHQPEDAKRLLQFLLCKQSDEKMITLAMGPAGKITRLLSPLLGGYLTFTSNDPHNSELGHIANEVLHNIYHLIQPIVK